MRSFQSVRWLLAVVLGFSFVSYGWTQPKTDCSKYSGVEKEACEKLARKKNG